MIKGDPQRINIAPDINLYFAAGLFRRKVTWGAENSPVNRNRRIQLLLCKTEIHQFDLVIRRDDYV